MNEPSAALTKPARPLRTVLLVGGAAAVLVMGGLGAGMMAAAQTPSETRAIGTPTVYVELTPASQPVDSQEGQAASNAQEAAIAQAAAEAAAAAQAAAEAAAQAAQQNSQQGSSGPARCPSGTVANAVDAAGNESNCQATNAGQQCVEYDAANQCVTWYKP